MRLKKILTLKQDPKPDIKVPCMLPPASPHLDSTVASAAKMDASALTKSKSKNVPSHRDQKKIVRTNLKDPDAPKTILDALADSILPAGLGPDDNRR